jgi:hypothetical protein
MKFHLAQVNVARMKAPLDDPIMAPFAKALDEINRLAESSPGFVWRFQAPSGNDTEFRVHDDPLILFNLSVWESVEALKDYVYKSMHGKFFARRKEWFEEVEHAQVALWWIPAGCIPAVEEAKARLDHLRAHGPTTHAFTFGDYQDPQA